MVGAVLGGVAGLVGQVLLKKKKPATPAPVAAMPVAQVRTNSLVSDALARRRGSMDNQRTGRGGAESSAGPKKSFMGT